VTSSKWLDFGCDPDHIVDPGILKGIFTVTNLYKFCW